MVASSIPAFSPMNLFDIVAPAKIYESCRLNLSPAVQPGSRARHHHRGNGPRSGWNHPRTDSAPNPAERAGRESLAHAGRISTRLKGELSPRRIFSRDLGSFKCPARASTTSELASPFEGGATTQTRNCLSPVCRTSRFLARGRTWTSRMTRTFFLGPTRRPSNRGTPDHLMMSLYLERKSRNC